MKAVVLEELRVEAQDLVAVLTSGLGLSPLRSVSARLVEFIQGVLCAVDNGRSPTQLRAAIGSARDIVSMLPSTFGRRFEFDAAVIASALDEWDPTGTTVSRFMIPRYAAGWGYCRIVLPSENTDFVHTIRVVTFPGADRRSDIDLSDYPWLVHELAHDAFYRSMHDFRSSFGGRLDARLQELRLRTTADTGGAARRAAQHLEAMARYWTPRLDQHDWAHEIATDVAATWSLGPAFPMRFVRLLVEEPGTAWMAGDHHPPHVTRAEALALAAERLGWADEAWALREEVAVLRESLQLDSPSLMYADAELVLAAVEASLEACQALSIPPMRAERFTRLRLACKSGEVLGLSSIDLIAAAAIARANLTTTDYSAWHDRAVDQF
jgi:hypothetical protein